MLKIVLLCAGGASTGMLAKKIEQEAKTVGVDCVVEAHAIAEAAKYGKEADIVMLGPQVGYRLQEVQNVVTSKPVVKIEMADYGQMNGKKILKQAIKAIRAFQE